MKNVYFKIFTRIFVLFSFLNSSFWLGYLLKKIELPDSISHFALLIIIFIHIGMAIAVFNEFPENKQ